MTDLGPDEAELEDLRDAMAGDKAVAFLFSVVTASLAKSKEIERLRGELERWADVAAIPVLEARIAELERVMSAHTASCSYPIGCDCGFKQSPALNPEPTP